MFITAVNPPARHSPSALAASSAGSASWLIRKGCIGIISLSFGVVRGDPRLCGEGSGGKRPIYPYTARNAAEAKIYGQERRGGTKAYAVRNAACKRSWRSALQGSRQLDGRIVAQWWGVEVRWSRTGPGGKFRGLTHADTSFVGRSDAVGKVVALLDHYRLVTVTGPGGVGKTRLADEVLRQVADRFADGIGVVELAAISDPALVAGAAVTPGQACGNQRGRSIGARRRSTTAAARASAGPD
jgi:hypothetical protein